MAQVKTVASDEVGACFVDPSLTGRCLGEWRLATYVLQSPFVSRPQAFRDLACRKHGYLYVWLSLVSPFKGAESPELTFGRDAFFYFGRISSCQERRRILTKEEKKNKKGVEQRGGDMLSSRLLSQSHSILETNVLHVLALPSRNTAKSDARQKRNTPRAIVSPLCPLATKPTKTSSPLAPPPKSVLGHPEASAPFADASDKQQMFRRTSSRVRDDKNCRPRVHKDRRAGMERRLFPSRWLLLLHVLPPFRRMSSACQASRYKLLQL
ncbi:hypothetical protein LZ30DRAFT_469842 [Colletotrichum cereale]|nr:hypothetical protein LZ30DRAFT_469842 [Colletotrichum cereale]